MVWAILVLLLIGSYKSGRAIEHYSRRNRFSKRYVSAWVNFKKDQARYGLWLIGFVFFALVMIAANN